MRAGVRAGPAGGSGPVSGVRIAAGEIAAAARRAGRRQLLEPEGYALLATLGIATPRHAFLPDEAAVAAADLSAIPGDRLVLKLVSPAVPHKTEVGGVAIVSRRPSAIAAEAAAMRSRLGGLPLAGFLVCEHVDVDPGPGGELLVALRWDEAFGPVVLLGMGGTASEALAAELRPERRLAAFSPLLPRAAIAGALRRSAVGRLAAAPLRGKAPRVSEEALVGLVERLLLAAQQLLPESFVELEVNPLALLPQGPVALDVLVTLGAGPAPRSAARPLDKLDRLLAPWTVTVLGASSRSENPGRIIVRNLLREGFPGERLHLVRPGVAADGSETLEGCRCWPDLGRLPGPVDLAVLAVEAGRVPDLVDEIVAGELAETVVLVPGALGERPGTEGLEGRLRGAVAAARGTPWRGPLLVGGNSLGVRSVPGRVDTLFIPDRKLARGDGPPTPLALVAASGAFAVARWSRLGMAPRYVVSIGNQVDLTLADALEGLAEDPEVAVLAGYLEGLRPGDGERLVVLARRLAREGRALVLFRAGRTAAGAAAAASHTASIAGDDLVTRQLCEAAGALMAETLEDFDDLVRLALLLRGKRVGRSLAVVSNAGFEAVVMADGAGDFHLVALAEPTLARLGEVLAESRLDALVTPGNPLDVTPMLGDRGFAAAVAAVLDDPGVDVALVGCVPLTAALATTPPELERREPAGEAAVGPRLAELAAESGTALVAVVDGGPPYDPLRCLLAERGVPVFGTADRALAALGAYCRWRLLPR